MIGISIAAKREWKAVLDRFQINLDSCTEYPFGEYFITEINEANKDKLEQVLINVLENALKYSELIALILQFPLKLPL